MNQQEYAKKIAQSYQEKTITPVDTLKKMDRKIKRPANIFAYTFGTISALVLGVGMCLAMKVLADLMALGIVIGVIGIAMCLLTYPIYKKILTSAKKKNASAIIKLSNEILNAQVKQ